MPKKSTLIARFSDVGTPELKNHHKIIIEQTDENTQRARNITQMPMDWYAAHKHITKTQWQAGNKVYEDFIYSGRYHLTVSCFTKTTSNSPPFHYSEQQLYARKRFYKALDQLEQEGQRLVVNICCLGEWAHQQGMSRKYAITRLRSALDELAHYFGMNDESGGQDEK
jgi:hypothetical protein